MEQRPDYVYFIVVIFLGILFFVAIKQMFKKTDASDWERRLSRHFAGVEFPILIVGDNSAYVVETFEEYANDPDFYYHDLSGTVIDSKGDRYVWLLDQEGTKIPSEKGDPISFEEFKSLVIERFPKLQQVQDFSGESFSTLMQRIIKDL